MGFAHSPLDAAATLKVLIKSNGDATAIDWIELTTAGKTRRWEF